MAYTVLAQWGYAMAGVIKAYLFAGTSESDSPSRWGQPQTLVAGSEMEEKDAEKVQEMAGASTDFCV